MGKNDVYRLLEGRMLTYAELINVPVVPCDEPLVPIIGTENLRVNPNDRELMAEFTGSDVFVRQVVAARLGDAAIALSDYDTRLSLEVVYGYRPLSIQTVNFERAKRRLSVKYSGVELMEAAHRQVAVPDIAGHPAGAAVDIQIVKSGVPLNFGTRQRQFVPDTYTFSPFIGKEAFFNRMLLRRIMEGAGFAPFDGEWWHFSYGDREWAKIYGQPNAIYEQVEYSIGE